MTTKAKKKRKLLSSTEVLPNNNELYPCRNIENLYASRTTINCALGSASSSSTTTSSTAKPCIPCAYKIATFDIALDLEFTQIVKNTRPELCPRSNNKSSLGIKSVLGYTTQGMKILTLGDGDFTFSLALARLFHKVNNSNYTNDNDDNDDYGDKAISILATSYESKSTLQKVYPSINETIAELEKYKFVQIAYEVDATQMANTLPRNMKEEKFHRLIWNFPCTAESNGQDGQNNEMEENKRLIEKFVYNCIPFMDDTKSSEIQMIHKTKPPYDQWKIEHVALNGWKNGNKHDSGEGKLSCCPLEYKGRIAFDRCIYYPYVPRKAKHRKSFPCHDACLYIFGWKKLLNEHNILATIHRQEGKDVDAEGKEDDVDQQSNDQIVQVDTKMIDKIRKVHLLYAKNSMLGQKNGKLKKKHKSRC